MENLIERVNEASATGGPEAAEAVLRAATPEKTDEHRFYQGFACALAELMYHFDRPTLVQEIMRKNGVTVKMLRDAKVDPDDLKRIREAME